MMTKEEYEAKRAARYERLKRAAQNAQDESNRLLSQARQMSDAIPFGQPIITGRSNTGADINYRNRIQDKYRRGFDLYRESKVLSNRVENFDNNPAISSDDPSAPELLAERIKVLEELQVHMKKANALCRKDDLVGLQALGLEEIAVFNLMHPSYGKPGYPAFALTNNNANLKRLKDRLLILQQRANDVTSTTEINGIVICDNCEINRVTMKFPSKPQSSIIDALKHGGFHWSHDSGLWMRMRSFHATQEAMRIAKLVNP